MRRTKCKSENREGRVWAFFKVGADYELESYGGVIVEKGKIRFYSCRRNSSFRTIGGYILKDRTGGTLNG